MFYKSKSIPKFVFTAVVVLCLTALPGGAQTTTCGQPQLGPEDSATEIRFIRADVAHVRASVLRAIPVLGANLSREKAGVIEAKIDMALAGRSSSIQMPGSGTFTIEITPVKLGGTTGSLLRVEFAKGWVGAAGSRGTYATPLADEVECLIGLLSPVEPSSNPRGQTSVSPPAEAREVSVPAKTALKIALRNYLFSRDFEKGATKAPSLEIVEDVVVDGTTVFRKGALAKGKLTGFTTSGIAQHGASIQFTIESATAVDGQEIALDTASMKERGGLSRAMVTNPQVFGGLLPLLLMKGQEALVPAGKTFEVLVSLSATVKGEPEPVKPPASSQASPATGQPAETIKSATSVLNLDGIWNAHNWGELRLIQTAGERELIGIGGGYVLDGVVTETGVVLHFRSGESLEYTAELTSKGDGILVGRYVYGEMRPDSKTKPIGMHKFLSMSPRRGAEQSELPPGLNLEGTWNMPHWGDLKLTQAAGDRKVTGKNGRYVIDGFVSGKRVVLHWLTRGYLSYSAILTPKEDGTLSGEYASGPISTDTKTSPIEMSRQK
jgi:hypothetical protein